MFQELKPSDNTSPGLGDSMYEFIMDLIESGKITSVEGFLCVKDTNMEIKKEWKGVTFLKELELSDILKLFRCSRNEDFIKKFGIYNWNEPMKNMLDNMKPHFLDESVGVLVDIYNNYLVNKETGQYCSHKKPLYYIRGVSKIWKIDYQPEFQAYICDDHFESKCHNIDDRYGNNHSYKTPKSFNEIQTMINNRLDSESYKDFIRYMEHEISIGRRDNFNRYYCLLDYCDDGEPRSNPFHLILSFFLSKNCASIVVEYL